ncbi:MAG: anaerobic carbon-monoxide dehydrogenase catalytic subunit [Desulfovibrionaceae bacterium]
MAKTPPRSPEELAVDPASVALIQKSRDDGVDTCFSRYEAQKNKCAFGVQGVCCRNCHMGPCRITPKAPRGVCGADADTIAARNFLREVAAGAAAHSDHARHLVLLLAKVAEGKGGNYAIKDEAALRRAAREVEIAEEGLSIPEVARDLAALYLRQFTLQEETSDMLVLAPLKRQNVWAAAGVAPKGIDRMVVEAMHRTHVGVDHDPENILLHAMRTALADGWAGSQIATKVSDILFGTPMPVRSKANLGVLGEKTVNVLVHGHEPALSEMLAAALRDPEVKARAVAVGAEGVRLAGICCTANEILIRHGIPVAGNVLQQELAIVTGAVELMITDVQCVMPSLPGVAASYHTEVVSTSDIARTVGAKHAPFDHAHALQSAKELLFRAIDNFSRRDPAKVCIPQVTQELVAGFSVQAIKYMLGGTFRASFRPLNDAIIQGRIRGVAGIVGCNNPCTRMDDYTNTVTRELLKHNVLVLKTGCAAVASAKSGMLTPEAALRHAGPGLREVCETVGMPPVLHMGSCVDNSRILHAAAEVVAEGGLGEDMADIPAVGIAPEWMSEKAVAIGCYFVASGIDVVLGGQFHVTGAEAVNHYLHRGAAQTFGASFHVEEDPMRAVEKTLALLDARRRKLGIDKKAERKLFDMKDRRTLDV